MKRLHYRVFAIRTDDTFGYIKSAIVHGSRNVSIVDLEKVNEATVCHSWEAAGHLKKDVDLNIRYLKASFVEAYIP